ncbi:MAG: CcoQ/FixQ family Cbb3-type cytochrome c oxidase assembly chaperone, partial [Roseomonas sp.]|nr:CcoQ/FixQ family Cbb3-type cytochrome c oxidase assembly chaperone [Roseomonas sp.]
MESLVELYPALRALWVVWFFVLFLGMVWFVMRPSRRKHFES